MKNYFSLLTVKRTTLSPLASQFIFCSKRLLLLVWFVSLMFTSHISNASILYVGVQGTNVAGSGTEQLPFQTIQFAYSQANSTDTIILLPGIYHQQFTFAAIKDVVLASKYLLTQDTSFISTTIIDGSQYFGQSALIEIQGGASKISIKGLTVQNSTARVLFVSNSGNSNISNCYFKNNGNSSLWGTLSINAITNSNFSLFESRFIGNRGRYIIGGPITIERCFFSANGQGQGVFENAIIYPEHNGAKSRILYNYFTGNHIPCIAGGGNANGMDSVEIINNTIINNNAAGFYVQNYGGGQKFYLTNNIIQGNVPNVLFNNSGYSYVVFRNNYISPFSKNIEPSPLNFLIVHIHTDSTGNGGLRFNPNNGLFDLAPSSKLIGAGATIASLSADFLGQVVPSPLNTSPDLGAIESNAGAPTIVFDSIQPVCSSQPNFLLNNVSPPGGTFAGPGILNGNTFSPSLAGAGRHVVLYTFINANSLTIIDSFEIEVLFAPVVQLSNLGDSILCFGGSAVLVADSVPGATYRWIQEGAVVNGLKVEVFSTHAGVGSNNDYPSFPSTRVEFDKFFDTTYQSTRLHYQGRHNALQSLSWSGMSALTNAGIAVPNNGDFFAVQVSGFFNPTETGTYRFNASSDDHMDLIIGDSLVLSSYLIRNGQINLQAGQRVTFKARMQEYGGHESFNVRWEKPIRLNSGPVASQIDTMELNSSLGTSALGDTARRIIADESGTYHAEVTTTTGCTVSSNALRISVLPLPVVTLAAFNPVCLTDSVSIPLTSGRPLGGTYSGVGVSNGVFNSLTAGAGVHEIFYTYTDSTGNGCTNTASQKMVVLPLTVNMQVANFCAPGQAIASIADSSVYGVQWFRNNQLIKDLPVSYAFSGQVLLSMSNPQDMALDAQGNRFVLQGNRVIRYAAGQQNFTVVAGQDIWSSGSALNQLHNPRGIAIDAAGNVYVADHSNHRIMRWAPGDTAGVVVAGSALGIQGTATNQLNHPYHLKFDGLGRLYVTDRDNHRVMRYPATVSTTTTVLAGTVIVGAAGNGSGNNQLNSPHALFIDVQTNRMYVSDDNNARIMRYDLSATNVANSGTRVAGGNGHGAGLNQFSNHIAGILVQGGDIYLADFHGSRIMRWREGAASGQVIAGGTGYGSDLFRTSRPTAVRIDAQGNLEYLERDHARLVRFGANSSNSDTLAFTEAGVYRAEFKRFGLNCASTSTNFTINKPIAQISSSRGSTVCEGDTTTLSTPALAGYAYQWYKNGQSIAGANTNTYITSVPGSYTVETGDSSGCFNTSEAFVIHAEPQVSLTANGLCLGSELKLTVQDSSLNVFEWFKGNQVVARTHFQFAGQAVPIITGQPNLQAPEGMFVAKNGYVYVADSYNHRVLKIDPQGNATVVAGGNGNGPASNQTNLPQGVFVDAAGNLYVAESGNNRVSRWSPGASTGVTVAGRSDAVAGSALSSLNGPMGIWLDVQNNLFVADRGNHRVVRWAVGASVGVRVAGTGTAGGALNELNAPWAITMDNQQRLYVADVDNRRILRFASGSLNGELVAGGEGWGNGLNQLTNPFGLAVDAANYLYVTDHNNNRVMRWAPGSKQSEIILGNGALNASQGQFGSPMSIGIDKNGSIIVLDRNAGPRMFSPELILTDSLLTNEAGVYTVRAIDFVSGCSSQSNLVNIFSPEVNLTSSKGKDICLGDTTIFSTVQNATYTYQWFRDGAQIAGAAASSLTAFDPGLYHVEVLDSNACSRTSESMRIWPKPMVTLTADGLCLGSLLQVSTTDSNVVGFDWLQNGSVIKQVRAGFEEEGEAFVASNSGGLGLNQPFDLATDYLGNIYYSEHGNHRVVRLAPDGSSPLVVAGSGSAGSGLSALDRPTGIFVDAALNVYVADMGNHRVVKWAPGATQGELVAGTTGVAGSTLARLNEPMDVVVDDSGAVYVADRNNHRVVRWMPNATSGTLFAGTGQSGSSTNQLSEPHGLAIWGGSIYISDHWNGRIVRKGDTSTSVVAFVTLGGNTANPNEQRLSYVHVDKNGAVYFTEMYNSKVIRYLPGGLVGDVIAGGNAQGNAANQLGGQIHGITTDMNGNLYVADGFWNQRIMKYTRLIIETDSFVPITSGSYGLMTHTVQGCSYQHSGALQILSPEVNLTSSAGLDVCEGDTTQLSTIQNATYTYQWFKDGAQIAGATASSHTAFDPGLYHVEVLDSNACSRTSESMRIWPKPMATLTANGLCLGSQLTTNVPDSNVVQIDWFRNNQLVKQVSRKYLSAGQPVLGNFNGWINNISFHWGMGDFHIHTDGSIYISDMHDRRVVRYFPSTGQFTVVAGGNGSGNALNQLDNPQGVFVTPNGDVFVADYGNHRVVRWSPGATVGVVVAGATGQSGSALNRLHGPLDVFVDQSGQLFIADEQNHRVMRWAPNATSGVLVAGSTGQVGSALNQLHSPARLFVSSSGLLYVSDISNNRVMRYAPGSSTGTIVAGGNGAGIGLQQLNTPVGIFVDQNEALYIADLQNNRVVKWNNGATAGQVISNNDSLSMPNRVNQPRSLAIGPNKELYVVSNSQLLLKFGFDSMTSDLLVPENAGTYFIKMLTKQGCENSSTARVISSPDVNLQSSIGFDVCEGDTTQLSTIQNAGYTYRWLKDGIQVPGATNSLLSVSQPGLYQVEVTDSNNCSRSSETLRVWPKPLVSLTADGVCLGSELLTNTPDSQVVQIDWFRNNQLFRNTRANFKANGSAHLGYFNGLWLRDIEFQGVGISDVHVHHDGVMYVLAQTNQFSGISVLKYTPNANAFVLVAGGNGFGSALNQIGGFGAASFGYGGLFVAENGDIYVADRTNHRVVKWAPGASQGVLVAGGNGSGSALNQLSNPQSVFVNGSGDVFVVDQSNHRVVRWSIGANTGVVVAGGNGSGAGLNQFNNPRFVTATSNGDLYISDQNNHRVVRYAAGASTGVLVAGGNFSGSAVNQLNQPNGIAVDKSGNVFVADRFNNRIVRWAPGSTSGEVVAGLNPGNTAGLGRTTRPVSLKLGSDYKLYVTSVDTVNGSINLNNSNRLMSFELNKLVADTLRVQQGGNYSVVFTNTTGCSNQSQQLSVFNPQVNFPVLANSCISDAALLLNNATPAGGTYFGIGVDTGYFHPTIAGVGTHKLYYLYTDSNGCSKLDSQTIQVVPEPVVSIDTLGSMNLCQGESVVLQSPLVTGQTYQWYRNGVLIPQATQRAFTVLDTVSAQYHVMVTRNVCEKSSDTLNVVVRPKPVVTITNQGAATICQGDSVVLQAASDTDVTYQWYRNNQLLVGSTQTSLVANQSGSYTCQVIKANGCADTSNVLALTVLDFPIAQITPASATTVCDGQIVLLNANQAAGLTHRWFRNGVLIPGATSANYQATTSGDYTVEVMRQQLCETLSQAVTVVVNPLPQISIAATQGNQFCSGDSILITAQSTAQVLRFAWFRNGQLTPSDSTANFYATLPGHYHARVFDSAGCDQASDSVLVGYFNPPFANEAICAISVDTLAGRNVVVWEKTAGVRTSSYNVYREGAISGQYILIGNVPYDSLSIFIDTTANPLSQSFRYRIATVDSCGFVSAQSSVHRTIHLSSNIGVNNEVNLFWTTYEGVVVPTHRILRSINGGPFVEIASVSGTTFTYTDLTPPQGAKNYLIEIAIPGGCNPTGLRLGNLRTASSYGSIQSNKVAVGSGVSVINRSLAGLHTLYPNPSNGLLTLVRSEQQMGDQVFKIYDARGRLVKTIRFEDQSLVYQIDMVEAADGIYTIRANDSNWSARFVIAK